MNNYSLRIVNWDECSEICRTFYRNNEYLSPYSDYDFMSSVVFSSNIRQRKDFKRFVFKCFLLSKNGAPIYIAPFFVNRTSHIIYLAGHFNSVGHIDFLYNRNVELEDFKTLLDKLGYYFSDYHLCLDRISQFSKTYFFLKEMNISEKNIETCVKIDFDNYNSWFCSLPKGHRQNIRTAYNRINREKLNLSFSFFFKKRPEKKFYRDHISLFSRRILEHSKLPSLLYIPMKLLKKSEPLTKALLFYRDKIFSGLYLNKKLIASLNGVISNDGRAIITRLSINRDFGVYCPGGMLINETIKAIDQLDDRQINSLDLSRGDEKYKYTYGGVNHYNYSYVIQLR